MRISRAIVLLAAGLALAACSAPAPTWRAKAASMVSDLGRDEAVNNFPQEYRSLTETFEHGEAIIHVKKNDREADLQYLLVLQKGALLSEQLKRLKEEQLAEQRRQAAELAARLREEQLMREAAEAEERLRKAEEEQQEEEAKRVQRQVTAHDPVPVKPTSYTVHRGETLPQIAARTEIYNDSSLWPIIYRANRDQVRDPRQLWPGQVLKIPRKFSSSEAAEAKRYSGKSAQ